MVFAFTEDEQVIFRERRAAGLIGESINQSIL